jgi:hypothetical protein
VLFTGCQNIGIMPGYNNSQQQQKQLQLNKKILTYQHSHDSAFSEQKTTKQKSGHWRTNPSKELQYFNTYQVIK